MATPAKKFTPELLREIYADRRLFCGLLKVRLKKGGEAPFVYENWFDEQRQFFGERSGRDIVIKPRQIGFTTFEIAADVLYAITNRRVQVLIVVHDADLANGLFLDVQYVVGLLDKLGIAPGRLYSNRREILFDNGSAVRVTEAGATEVAASKKGRSGTIHRLHATEVAYWGAADKTMGALLNAVPSEGEIVIESTANGVGNWFHRKVMESKNGTSSLGLKLHFFPWFQHGEYRDALPHDFDPEPRDQWEQTNRDLCCDDNQIQWWRRKVSETDLELTLQENPPTIDAAFRAMGSAYIEARHIDAISGHVVDPVSEQPIVFEGRALGTLLIWREPEPLHSYAAGSDVSEGVGADRSTVVFIDHETAETCAVFFSDHISPGDLGLALDIAGRFYNGALVAVERNNHGAATLRALTHEAFYPNVYHHDDERPGWPTNVATRSILFDELARGIAEAAIYTPHAETLTEARTLIRDKDGKPRARDKSSATGCKDDLYVAWAIAIQVRSRHPIN